MTSFRADIFIDVRSTESQVPRVSYQRRSSAATVYATMSREVRFRGNGNFIDTRGSFDGDDNDGTLWFEGISDDNRLPMEFKALSALSRCGEMPLVRVFGEQLNSALMEDDIASGCEPRLLSMGTCIAACGGGGLV